MLPKPPPLKRIIAKRDPAELFYIVKHGIKFTGMPAWPAAHRDDEVWAMVAFLRELPNIDASHYRKLAGSEGALTENAPIEDMMIPSSIRRILTDSCARCHGVDGLAASGEGVPALAGQKEEYLVASLEAYAHGQRPSGIMGPVAAGLSRSALLELAAYYSRLPGRTNSAAQAEPAAVERGRAIAREGIPVQRVAACVECHGPGSTPTNPLYPVLAGQSAVYLESQLDLFSQKRRGGTVFSHLMHFTAAGLTPAQRRDLAQFYASLTSNRVAAPGNSQ